MVVLTRTGRCGRQSGVAQAWLRDSRVGQSIQSARSERDQGVRGCPVF
ncbi:MAG: hypothetical protein KZQ88_05865 [Candidatus Thiodiazotropha sp. (ex Dulcina madagascariensis)]|nr:hypothetical protein [Candidatus Thiodiazotropha sp. (ex Dulcina madagascariensis)]MCU7924975.1 hypothetical protein [Candidatus Thiodiazotropha sp. (ex Dulcina madagascariensis)]